MTNETKICDHQFTYREIDGETWEVCFLCGFGEMWASGMLIKTTDEAEAKRLDALIQEMGWGDG